MTKSLPQHALPNFGTNSPNQNVARTPTLDDKFYAPYCIQDYRLIPPTNMSLFNMFFPHSRIFQETSQKVTHPNITPSQARLIVELLYVRKQKDATSCWYK